MNLISLTDLKRSEDTLRYYFDDVWYDGEKYTFTWPSENFKHMCAVHDDNLKNNGIPIRKWVETVLQETVITTRLDKSYNIFHTKEKDWRKMHTVSNIWHQFWFDNAESATMFALAFSDIVSTITDTHPTNHYEPTH